MDLPFKTLKERRRSSACFSGGDHELFPALPQAAVRDGFILLLTVFLSSLAAAQTPAPPTVRAQELVSPIITRPQTVPVSSPARSFVLSEDPGKSAGHFSYLFVRAYGRDQGLENLSPIHRVKTLFLTQSSLPLFELWDGRLRLDAFTSRVHMQNLQFGPPASGGLQNVWSPRPGYPGGPHSVRFDGLSLSFPFRRDTENGRPTQTWRYFARFVTTATK